MDILHIVLVNVILLQIIKNLEVNTREIQEEIIHNPDDDDYLKFLYSDGYNFSKTYSNYFTAFI